MERELERSMPWGGWVESLDTKERKNLEVKALLKGMVQVKWEEGRVAYNLNVMHVYGKYEWELKKSGAKWIVWADRKKQSLPNTFKWYWKK